MDFDSLSPQPQQASIPQGDPSWDQLSKTAPGDTPNWDDLTPAQDKYGTPGQQAIAGLEGAAKGLLGPAATIAEKAIGVKPEDILGREEANPWTHGLAEAGGFGVGAFAGTGEAALLGRAGELAAHAVGLGEAATTGAKLAKGAVTAATEMGLFQAGDEASKWVLNAPQTPGSVVANIGLSALLGGVTGPAFTGLGLAAKSALNSTTAKEFMDRLAFRKANIDPQEMARHEAENVVSTYNAMNDELGGATGLKSQAIQKLLPTEITPQITGQIQEISDKMAKAIDEMRADKVPERYITKFGNDANRFLDVATSPQASVSQNFDAMNEFKRNLQDYSKGNWGPFAVPRYHEAYDFLNTTKNLSRDVRMALEDSKVWGGAADIQKQLNASWVKALPAMRDFEKKFMVKVGDVPEISGDKFNTYFRQGLKNTSTTDRQAIMGNFIDAMDNHFNTVDDIYRAAGVENPNPAVGMSMLKESIEKPSLGGRLADLWHDKLGPSSIGNTLGASVGGSFGGVLGHGLGGVYLGREILGPVFGSVLKPMMEKYPNVDIGALEQAMRVAKSVERGNSNLAKVASGLFQAGKTFPSHLIPDTHELEKLDKQAMAMGQGDGASIANVPGNVGYYMGGHDVTISKTAGDAVSFLNAQRPAQNKQLPLDSMQKPSRSQDQAYQRTLSIAQQPLLAVRHIENGTLIPQDVQTVKALYPAYYSKMSEQLTEALAEHVQEGGYVPYQTRQSLSLFLGGPLDSTLTPQAIHASQSVYQAQAQAKANALQQPAKKNSSKLSKISDNYLTADQGSSKRRAEG